MDHGPLRGRFVLTGSQNFLLLEAVSQTLAGRCGILHLLPFFRGELERQTQAAPAPPSALFGNRETRLGGWTLIHSGGYPHPRPCDPA
jgi:predicted AAA+ superfamily ATPase